MKLSIMIIILFSAEVAIGKNPHNIVGRIGKLPTYPNGLIKSSGFRSADDPFGLYEQYPKEKEIIHKRTLSSKTFAVNESTYASYFTVGGTAIHYVDSSGNLKNIDLTLRKSNDKIYPYYNKTNVFKSYYPGENLYNAGVMVKLDSKNLKLMKKQNVYMENIDTGNKYNLFTTKIPSVERPVYYAIKYDFGDEIQSEFRLKGPQLLYDIKISPCDSLINLFDIANTSLIFEYDIDLPDSINIMYFEGCKTGYIKETQNFLADDYIYFVSGNDTIGGISPVNMYRTYDHIMNSIDDVYRKYPQYIAFTSSGLHIRTTIPLSDIIDDWGGSFPVILTLTIFEQQINSNYNDIWANYSTTGSGCANQNNNYIRLGCWNSYNYVYIGGMRFTNINIPYCSTITDADLRITASDYSDANPGYYPAGYVYAFDVDDCENFSPICTDGNCNNDSYCYSQNKYPIIGEFGCDNSSNTCPCGYQHLAYCTRWGAKTSANRNWTWMIDWTANTRYWVADDCYFAPQPCDNVIQEIINRSGWSSGNSITILYGYDWLSGHDDLDYYWARDGSATEAPILHIEYTAFNPPNAPSGFSGIATSCSTIVWTWNDNSTDEAGFEIFSSPDNTLLHTTGPNITSWTETDVHAETTYTRYVKAYTDACGGAESSSSENGTVTPNQCILGYVSIWTGTKVDSLRIIAVRDAPTNAVVKVVNKDGKIGAADLVDTSDANASKVRIFTPAGIRAWRKK